MAKTGLSTVLVTFPDRTVADSIISDLMEGHLIACANIFPVESSYRWKDRVSMPWNGSRCSRYRTRIFIR